MSEISHSGLVQRLRRLSDRTVNCAVAGERVRERAFGPLREAADGACRLVTVMLSTLRLLGGLSYNSPNGGQRQTK